jgi:siroheme synthase-like protein
MTPNLYPLFLDLRNKPILVVGAGPVGTGKALALVEAGAAVTVVAPQASAEVADAAQAGALRWHPRPFEEADLDGVYLVVAAAGAPAVNAEVARLSAARRLFVNAVDDPQNATAYAASILRRGPVTLAISSAGRAPALCRMLRQLLQTLLPAPDEMTRWVTQAEALRRTWQKEKVPMRSRYEKLLETLYQNARAEAAP